MSTLAGSSKDFINKDKDEDKDKDKDKDNKGGDVQTVLYEGCVPVGG